MNVRRTFVKRTRNNLSWKWKGHTRSKQRITKSHIHTKAAVMWFACASLFFRWFVESASKAITAFCYIYLHFITRPTARVATLFECVCQWIVLLLRIRALHVASPTWRIVYDFHPALRAMDSSKKNWHHVYLIRAVFRCFVRKAMVSFFFYTLHLHRLRHVVSQRLAVQMTKCSKYRNQPSWMCVCGWFF